VGAIKRSGEINMNECFYCLDCQVTYYDDHICPPMVWRRKRLLQPGTLARLPVFLVDFAVARTDGCG